MRLVKRLIELAFGLFLITFFMKNQGIELQISYYGLSQPIKVAFWELVTFCVALGIIIAAVGDFITQLKWLRERRRMIKTDHEHQSVVDGLNARIESLETENQRLKSELDSKIDEIVSLKRREEQAAPRPLSGVKTPTSEEPLDSASQSSEKK
jgi:hypothetical protein